MKNRIAIVTLYLPTVGIVPANEPKLREIILKLVSGMKISTSCLVTDIRTISEPKNNPKSKVSVFLCLEYRHFIKSDKLPRAQNLTRTPTLEVLNDLQEQLQNYKLTSYEKERVSIHQENLLDIIKNIKVIN